MRKLLFTTFSALGLALAAPAMAATIVTAGAGEITALYLDQTSEISTSDAGATAAEIATWLGAPNNVHTGIGGQWVQYDLGNYRFIDGAGQDFNVYELGSNGNGPEFGLIDVLVSANGVDFFNVESTAAVALNLAGDGTSASPSDRRSYDLGGAVTALGVTQFRYLRIDGAGTGLSGGSSGFDLDAVGFANFVDATPPPVGGVPEPATWALLIGGFGAVGTQMRKRRHLASVAA